jgi:hypothetical protein
MIPAEINRLNKRVTALEAARAAAGPELEIEPLPDWTIGHEADVEAIFQDLGARVHNARKEEPTFGKPVPDWRVKMTHLVALQLNELFIYWHCPRTCPDLTAGLDIARRHLSFWPPTEGSAELARRLWPHDDLLLNYRPRLHWGYDRGWTIGHVWDDQKAKSGEDED